MLAERPIARREGGRRQAGKKRRACRAPPW